jgi:hypothetical protein
MRLPVFAMLAIFYFASFPLWSQEETAPSGHYLFAWTGDLNKKGNDFLAVIDADPQSKSYGQLITTIVTDQQTVRVHHTEYVMPESGMLFANDHDAGRTFIFDLRDPLHPKIAASFTEMDGYMHPHSFVRLPNGHVLATFQHAHHGAGAGEFADTGGLVEIDDAGKVVRSASSADPAFAGALLTPYGLVVLPEIDRVVSTNSSMHVDDGLFRGVTYQVWRLSDLKLLQTEYFDVGENRYAQIAPEEPRRAPDGSVLVQTLGCGLERITAIDSQPHSKLVYTFPGDWCGVPTVIGHYLVQSVPAIHGLIALNITNEDRPLEVSRLKLDNSCFAHWTGWDAKTQRLVVTGCDSRMYLVKFDQTSGALAIDTSFHDVDGEPGFNFADREWPHGWKGSGKPHGVVFSR